MTKPLLQSELTMIYATHYRASAQSPWMAIPRMNRRSMALWVLLGTWSSVLWSNGEVTDR